MSDNTVTCLIRHWLTVIESNPLDWTIQDTLSYLECLKERKDVRKVTERLPELIQVLKLNTNAGVEDYSTSVSLLEQ